MKNGPDLVLSDIGVKVEAKSKLNRTFTGDLLSSINVLNESTCLKLLSKDAFESGRLDEAFKHPETDIAFINLFHSQYGDLFAAYAYYFDNKNFELTNAFDTAIKMVRKGKKAVVLYSEQISMEQPYSICAVASDIETVDYYGARLDKIERDWAIDTKTAEGYYKLVEEAKKLN